MIKVIITPVKEFSSGNTEREVVVKFFGLTVYKRIILKSRLF